MDTLKRKVVWISIVFVSLLAVETIFLFGFHEYTHHTIQSTIFHPLDQSNVFAQRTLTVVSTGSNGPKPAVILLHGDVINENSLNLLKLEFIANDYRVILLPLNFSYPDYFLINATLDYLLTRDDIDPTRIGILGHSHGAHYAFHMAWMRSDIIRSVICANFGTINYFYQDYFDIYNKFLDGTNNTDYIEYLTNFQFPLSVSQPHNLLLITNYYDPQPIIYPEQGDRTLMLWDIPEKNIQYGSFADGTARKVVEQASLFYHGSGIYDPITIHAEVEWMNQALDYPTIEENSLRIISRTVGLFMLIFLIGLFGIPMLSALLTIPPFSHPVKIPIKKTNDKNSTQLQASVTLSREYMLGNLYTYLPYKKTFRWVIIGIIGSNFFFYLAKFIFSTNPVIYFINPVQMALDRFFAYNDLITNYLYFDFYSFRFMYIWIFVVFIAEGIGIKDMEIMPILETIQKSPYKLRITFIYIGKLILGLGIFNYFFIYLWTGFDVTFSVLNLLFRFMILLYLQILLVEFIYIRSLKITPNFKRIYLETVGISLLLFLPIPLPEYTNALAIFADYYSVALFPIVPFVICVLFVPFWILRQKSLVKITIGLFYFLLFWHILLFF